MEPKGYRSVSSAAAWTSAELGRSPAASLTNEGNFTLTPIQLAAFRKREWEFKTLLIRGIRERKPILKKSDSVIISYNDGHVVFKP